MSWRPVPDRVRETNVPSSRSPASDCLLSWRCTQRDSFYLSICLTLDPPQSWQGPRLAYIYLSHCSGAQTVLRARLTAEGGPCWAGPLSLGPKNMAYLLFVSGMILFCKCAVATGQQSSSIWQALSLSPRYICTINKGEGLRPALCFDFIIYILFISYPHTDNHFLLEWQDLCG